jgi:hypothetical protein
MTGRLDDFDHEDAWLDDEDKEFLDQFDQDAEDRAAIEGLSGEVDEFWELEPNDEGDDDVQSDSSTE